MNYFEYLESANGIKLNNQQKSAVNFDNGNALVLSTAGSGKTTVIISRAGRLLYEHKCNKKILTITFSKMAAGDMKHRFSSLFGDEYGRRAEFSTIHAFCYKIVNEYFRRKNVKFEIIKNNYQILSEILKSYYSSDYYSYVSDEEIENLSGTIGYVNNMMINPDEYESNGIEIKGFDKLYHMYAKYKSDNRLLDFDDMLIYAYKIFRGSETFRNMVKSKYQYVQIDEMQDTSKIQHEIIKLVTDNNLFMVGDDDQSIYSFRGSYPDFMLDFKNLYKDGTIFYLDNNFRSDKNIVEGAKTFISKNKKRYDKAIHTTNEAVKEINIFKVDNRAAQCNLIIKKIMENADRTASISDNTETTAGISDNTETTAVLYRNNISSIILANGLYENKVNFYLKEDKTKFFKNPVLLDVLAFLNLALDSRNKEAFARIYYKSYTYFSKKMCQIVLDGPSDSSVFDILDNYKYFEKYKYDKIKKFKCDINYLLKLKPKEIIEFIKTEMEYMSYLERMNEEGRTNLSNAALILEILEEVGTYCINIRGLVDKIYSLQKIVKSSSENQNAEIVLTTIHSAKGLEYNRVFMIDNIDGEFPPDRKHMTGEAYDSLIEEERRVFYVGMTRAKNELNIIVPEVPSLFVNELIYNGKLGGGQKFDVGCKVKHKKHGAGVVADIKDDIIYIKFKNNKIRSFDLRFVLENNIIEAVN